MRKRLGKRPVLHNPKVRFWRQADLGCLWILDTLRGSVALSHALGAARQAAYRHALPAFL
jgi:hypothetical protein